jgi:hypothetical protein
MLEREPRHCWNNLGSAAGGVERGPCGGSMRTLLRWFVNMYVQVQGTNKGIYFVERDVETREIYYGGKCSALDNY